MVDGHQIRQGHHVLTVQVIASVAARAVTPAIQAVGITPVIPTVPAIWVVRATIVATAQATPVTATTPVRQLRRTTTTAPARRITVVAALVLRLITAAHRAIRTIRHLHSTAVRRIMALAVAEWAAVVDTVAVAAEVAVVVKITWSKNYLEQTNNET